VNILERDLGTVYQSRFKDRMSYCIEDQYVVDLTRVDTDTVNRLANNDGASRPFAGSSASTSFEVEIELLDPARNLDVSAGTLLSSIRSLLSITTN
jgi:hypothetical protein